MASDERVRRGENCLDRGVASIGHRHLEAEVSQHVPADLTHLRFVVDEQDAAPTAPPGLRRGRHPFAGGLLARR